MSALLAPPRFARHVLRLPDGHPVGVSIAGTGVPLVVVHGFGAEARMYAQPLARVASLGFRVVALDAPGHGSTGRLRNDDATLADAAALLERAIYQLGIRRAVLAGHSMGGRLAVEMGARRPDRTLAVVVADAIVGAPWDRHYEALRSSPAALARFTRDFWTDSVGTVPWTEPFQVAKMGWRAARTMTTHATRPWESVRAGMVIARSDPSVESLDTLARSGVLFVAIHGDDDKIVPIATSRDAVARTHGEMIIVRGGGHSWLLRCPETLPAIFSELLDGRLGDALAGHGVDWRRRTAREIEAVCLAPSAPLRNYGRSQTAQTVRRTPRYRWDRPVV